MYGIEDARAQYKAYADAAEASPVLQCRAELAGKGREWQRAGLLLKDLSDPQVDPNTGQAMSYESEYAIVTAGSLVGNMIIATDTDENSDTAHVIRVMNRDGQFSVHVTHTRMSAGAYINLAGPGSPVVVKL